jgi:aryl-alcohol dehydrogenase-like predicted oxidoreductase
MHYRKLGRTGLKVSELCLGTMQFGWTADEKHSYEILDAFVEAGGNFLDTADIYTTWISTCRGGLSEEIIGRWLKERGNRRDIVLATKVRGEMWPGPNGEGLSRDHIFKAVEDSLKRLQVDVIDLYQTHWVDLTTPIEETLRALDDLVRQGKVRYLGASNYPAWRLMEAEATAQRLGLHRFECYQPEYSLMERAGFEIEAMPFCKHYQVGVIPYSPLASGFLSGKYRRNSGAVESHREEKVKGLYSDERSWKVIDALEKIGGDHGKTVGQTALAWLLTNPVMTAPILGANNVTQLKDSLGAAGWKLTPDEMKVLNDLTSYPKNWRPIWD